MEEVSKFVQQHTSWSLSSAEVVRLYSKYLDRSTGTVDFQQLERDLLSGIVPRVATDANAVSTNKRITAYEEIINRVRTRLLQRIDCLKGESNLKKAHRLLGESRSSFLRRDQLRHSLSVRLSVVLSDAELDEIFTQLDNNREGLVSIRQLLNVILKSDAKATATSLPFNEQGRSTNQEDSLNSSKLSNALGPPDAKTCKPYSVADIEHLIWQKVFERANHESNMLKTLMRLFSNGENTSGEHFISLNQLKYTLWKRLRANISDADVSRFFVELRHGEQGIRMTDFVELIIKKEHISRPLLDDRSHAVRNSKRAANVQKQSTNLAGFLMTVRRKIDELINRESRAPHYLLHSQSMTVKQLKDFLRTKLRLDLDHMSQTVVGEVLMEYRSGDLIDVRRLLMEAMNIKEAAIHTPDAVSVLGNQTLLDGGCVAITDLPSTLSGTRLSPRSIEMMMRDKCAERVKNGHPHSTLYKLFRESDQETRLLSRTGLKRVLLRFDIILCEDDFHEFFFTHDRGDGMVDVHSLLRTIMPADDVDSNPFVPKDPAIVKLEANLAQRMKELTGKRRDVSCLNGPASMRVEPAFLQTSRAHSASTHNEVVTKQKSAPALLAGSTDGMDLHAHDQTVQLAESLFSAIRDLPLLTSPARPSTSYSTTYTVQHAMEGECLNRPKSASASTRDPALDPAYRKWQAERLIALAAAYTDLPVAPAAEESEKEHQRAGPVTPQTPKRPSSAPPSRPSSAPSSAHRHVISSTTSSISKPMTFSYNGQVTTRSTGSDMMSPRSPRSPRQQFDRNFVYSGQTFHDQVDPIGGSLLNSYRISRQHATTSSEDYGLFVKNLTRVMKVRKNVYERQRQAQKVLKEQTMQL